MKWFKRLMMTEEEKIEDVKFTLKFGKKVKCELDPNELIQVQAITSPTGLCVWDFNSVFVKRSCFILLEQNRLLIKNLDVTFIANCDSKIYGVKVRWKDNSYAYFYFEDGVFIEVKKGASHPLNLSQLL